jgi:hypothetical protein
MEVNNIINNSVNNDVSTLSSSINLKALENAKVTDANSSSFTLDIENIYKRSDFANTIKESLTQLAVNQNNLKQIDQQEKLLSQIQNSTQSIIESDNFANAEKQYQPVIEKAITEYNDLRVDYNSEFNKHQEETDSRGYFDGILGSRPLKTNEILDAVEKQRQQIAQDKEIVQNNINQIETKELKTIGKEIEKVMAEAPFKPIDFGKATSDFSATNIHSIVGSVATAQANAIPAHSQKLLA